MEEEWGQVGDVAPAGRPSTTTSQPPPPPPPTPPGIAQGQDPPPPPPAIAPEGEPAAPGPSRAAAPPLLRLSRRPPLPTLPTELAAEVFTPEYLQAIALHKKMLMEWGSVYLEELDARWKEQGVVEGINEEVREA